ncbi:helix-hairpin-helix domain-containing protein [Edaphobacillus lindanitolerans]|uniref:Competence protein ComEA n=1 Tax=Edaphobacillus lindanitolerans TaxID=550447 RepID=A0A1U7PQ37_9BACI|nr:helix-hairpin-helix domain-containing protein [Edaphobacillus lindanitolerans]SIT82556.1 competence protein ComEA [Edaphobacillus lindanitolerans]
MYWRKLIPLAAASILVLCIILYTMSSRSAVQPTDLFIASDEGMSGETADDRAEPSAAVIFVDVKGAVGKPGVYRAEEGDRVIDAIDRAGGFLPDANPDAINHAERLRDEMVVFVPLLSDEPDEGDPPSLPVQPGSAGWGQPDGRVNLNTADAAELMTLPGIGPAKAEAIIAHREQSGPFGSPEDLMDVSGIGEKTFARLEELITAK